MTVGSYWPHLSPLLPTLICNNIHCRQSASKYTCTLINSNTANAYMQYKICHTHIYIHVYTCMYAKTYTTHNMPVYTVHTQFAIMSVNVYNMYY